MGKYIIDIDEKLVSRVDTIDIKDGGFVRSVPVEPYTECSGKELLRAIRGLYSMPLADMAEHFKTKTRLADVIREFSAEEIVERYKQWKSKPEVGDEVINEKTGHKFVVTKIVMDGSAHGICSEGYVCYPLVENCKKTGRHFDSVKKLLKEIGE